MRQSAALFGVAFFFVSTLASAGDVTATVTGGVLHLTGGSGDEIITIDQVGVPDAKSFQVTPGAATTLNGAATPATFSGVSKDIVVELGDGTDSVTLTGAKVLRDFVVTGATDFTTTVQVTGSTIGDDLLLNNGGGVADMTVHVDNTLVKDDVKYTGTAGNDQLFLGGAGSAAQVHGDVTWNGGPGDDTVTFVGALVGGDVDLEGEGDSDIYVVDDFACDGDLKCVDLSGNNSFATAIADVGGALSIQLGSGNDACNPNGIHVTGSAKINLGDGTNTMNFNLCHVEGSLRIDGGAGNDVISVFDTCFVGGSVKVSLGNGMSNATLEDVVVLGDVKMKSGVDDDVAIVRESFVAGDVRFQDGGASVLTDKPEARDSTILGAVRFAADGTVLATVAHCQVKQSVVATFKGPSSSTGTFVMTESQIKQLVVTSGDGADEVDVMVQSSVKDDLVVDLGDGDNVVNLIKSNVGDDLKVTTGDGNDTFDFTDAVIAGKTTIHSGGGTDTGP